jgi:hypothetical protein
MVRSLILRETLGAIFIIAAGSLLHFTYALSGEQAWVAVFSATSESVWEHLKLAFWPGLAWALALAAPDRARWRAVWLGRTAQLVVAPAAIAVGYYAYTAMLGEHRLVLDLLLFVLAIALGQAAFVAIRLGRRPPRGAAVAALALLAVLTLAFSTLTFVPPDLPLFEEPTHADP